MSDERIFLGMTRPPQPPDTKYVDKETGETKYAEILMCSCEQPLRFRSSVQEHWLAGHFDTPVYATREEIIEKVAEKIAAGVPR